MSGLFAVAGERAASDQAAEADLLQARSAPRGVDRSDRWIERDALVAVTRDQWEMGPDFSADVLLLVTDRLVVAADASLYYRDDLRRALAEAGQSPPPGDSPSHLIAAAYLAWGTAGLHRLEGDFAFILWDCQARRLVAARDLTGTRPLFFAQAGGQVIVASRLGAVAAMPGVSRQLNRAAVAELVISAASLAVQETEYVGVSRLPAGHLLEWSAGSAPRVTPFVEGPAFDRGGKLDPVAGAAELRRLLGRAVEERLARTDTTSVWMSGGYDSPAIFGLAQERSGGRTILPVSMSYPEGDAGREDELIQAVADFHQVPVEWIRIVDVPLHPEMAGWARDRDEAFAHHYQEWNRMLAKGSRAAGSRIALSGNGGDQFFSVSPIFLADLLRRGRWLTLGREAMALGLRPRGYREFFHWTVQPNLPAAAHQLVGALRGGRRLRPHLQVPFPEWLVDDRELRQELRDRQWHYGLRRPGESFSSAESNWYLNTSFGQRVGSLVSTIAREAGVEVRSPMYDRRVLGFMAGRSREERFALGENKILLRSAVQGLLPAAHLERRRRRTGLPGGYLARAIPLAIQDGLAAAGESLFLEELHIVDGARLAHDVKRYLARPDREMNLGSQLFEVLAVELWLRGR